jgi:hypothetical protein
MERKKKMSLFLLCVDCFGELRSSLLRFYLYRKRNGLRVKDVNNECENAKHKHII